jgi:integrase
MPRPNTGPRLKWIDKRGGFYVVWYEAGRERLRSAGTADGRAAEAFLEEFLRDRQARGRPAGPRDPREFPIAAALDLYGRIHAPETADPARIGCAISALLPFWGRLNAGDVSKATCQRYARERGVKPATARRELGTLKAAINFAHAEGHITFPVPVWMPEKPEGKDRWLTKAEAARLLNVARTGRADTRLYLPLFILIALYTGARKEAVLSLRWPQIDLEAGRIDFAKGRRRTSKGRTRGQPIPDRLLTFLRLAWRRRSSDVGFVIHDKGRSIKDIGDSRHGSFGRACKKAGLVDVSPHTLRHTCGTWMAQEGTGLHDIGGWLGHSSARTTELYAHHHPDFMADAKRAADRRKA